MSAAVCATSHLRARVGESANPGGVACYSFDVNIYCSKIQLSPNRLLVLADGWVVIPWKFYFGRIIAGTSLVLLTNRSLFLL